jgi:hypothetical protein
MVTPLLRHLPFGLASFMTAWKLLSLFMIPVHATFIWSCEEGSSEPPGIVNRYSNYIRGITLFDAYLRMNIFISTH